MDEQPIRITAKPDEMAKHSKKEQAQLLLAQLMEGGQEDDETCKALDNLSKLLNDETTAADKDKNREPIRDVIDSECVDTILGYLDMRQSGEVRGHAILTASAYLKAAGDKASEGLKKFFFDRIARGTYDDFILSFSVAASVFPIAPDLTSEIFLTEGFLSSLGPLMRRTWKSKKVETACLEMLNAASMNSVCREAIQKYCTDWLEEIVDQDPNELPRAIHSADPGQASVGSIAMRRHSEAVQNLAAVILAKMRAGLGSVELRMADPAGFFQALPSAQPPASQENGPRIQQATTSIEDLAKKFTTMLLTDPDFSKQHSVEGLAYASIRPTVKEEVAHNKELLEALVDILAKTPPKSPLAYGGLSIFLNLTRYPPVQSEEEKKMNQLRAYANAAGKLAAPNPLNDHEHVSTRCKLVFEAGITPVLVAHSRNGSTASLSIIVSIIHALSTTQSIRGQLAQQGAVNVLIAAFSALPDSEEQAKRTAAQALARILISINPALVFGGTRSRPQSTAIRPLLSILTPDPAAETRDLLPTFEALMALTNLASTSDAETITTIIRSAWPSVEDLLLSSNHLVSKAAVELVCNLVQSVEGVALYAENTPQAFNRLHILLALADAEDEATRSAAGGALAGLTAYEEVVRAVVRRERGVDVVLGMCKEEKEDLRHRGVVVVCNMAFCGGEAGDKAREAIKKAGGVEVLTQCAKMSRNAAVVEGAVQALKGLLDGVEQ
ncbi:hypothetical protein DL766_007891 [Monosporascus sp. MC13-8B]|uniref:UNC-45/Cro1/She4 central domain-containing protein n=1 Tax=Monosporascus cannonballus TaxID=155416 RepID=A0ABY0H8D9_9PEZI|nr:hypothetical protein DL762_004393 [Monosporascus cannonballus]RYO95762.1 hypothetical protein DL763_003542 [Monosporascus cannonballus]RYP21617.1 hypothetical protein DL766_007891 [Monosporascus sp. MC13-8B]